MLIRQKRTGTPKELAEKLDISERWLYNIMEELKTELDCPIRYDRKRRSYIYERSGVIYLGFTTELDPFELRKVNGGEKTHCFFSLYV